jgi:hypothetical protein
MKKALPIIFGLILNVSNCYAFSIKTDTLFWVDKRSTIQLTTCNLIRNTNISDDKLTIIRFTPSIFNVDLIEYKNNNQLKTPEFWVDSFAYNIVVNAGMYDLKDEKKHRFFMQNMGLINNSFLDPNAKGIIAFNPIIDTISNFDLFDLTTINLKDVMTKYQSIIQGYRLIDDSGNPVFWARNNQFCSMIVIAEDDLGLIYLFFCRSPLTQNQMIENIQALNLGVKNAIYLEGGSKASFAINIDDFELNKMGSYVSNYHPFDDNKIMPTIPNLIGFRINN